MGLLWANRCLRKLPRIINPLVWILYRIRVKSFISCALFPGSAGILPAFENETSDPKPVYMERIGMTPAA